MSGSPIQFHSTDNTKRGDLQGINQVSYTYSHSVQIVSDKNTASHSVQIVSDKNTVKGAPNLCGEVIALFHFPSIVFVTKKHIN
jgi:hypothetical protein